MHIMKSFFMLFNHINDYHMVLFLLPILLQQKDKSKVYNAFFKITLSLCILILVKGSLRIPHPKYTNTFAFPSGHCWMMLTASYFLWKELVKKYLYFVFTLCAIEAGVCLFGGHHIITDVCGGFILSAIAIVFIEILDKKVRFNMMVRMICLTLFAIFVFYLIYLKAQNYAIKSIGEFLFYYILTIAFGCHQYIKSKK